jgi:chemotaxis protein MotB
MKKAKKPKKENSERWLLTYSDLITLLMILFILLFAMSNVNQDKYEALSASLSNSLGVGSGILEGSEGILPGNGGDSAIENGTGNQEEPEPEDTKPSGEVTPTSAAEQGTENDGAQQAGDLSGSISTAKDMKKFDSYMQRLLKALNIEDDASTTLFQDGLKISFADDVFFDSGQDTLKPDMKKGLGEIALLLNKIDNEITIEGHTDNVPISRNNKYSSNWQLSAARAANVAQFLCDTEGVDGKRLTAAGFGEYQPVASNETAEGKSMNRRVEIIILYSNEEKPK